MANVKIIDTETTGLINHPIHKHPQIIEIAELSLSGFSPRDLLAFDNWETFPIEVRNFLPSMEISLEATKIHGYIEQDLFHYPPSETLVYEEPEVTIGHNISYDLRCLNKKGLSSICTMTLFRKLNKNMNLGLENVKADYLVQRFFPEEAKILIKERHSASDDCLKVLLLLRKIVQLCPKIFTWKELQELQNKLK